MFRQIAPSGVTKKEAVDKTLSPGDALDSAVKVEIDQTPLPKVSESGLPEQHPPIDVQKLVEGAECPFAGTSTKEGAAPYPPAVVDVSKAEEKARRLGEGKARLEHPELPISAEKKEILAKGEQEGFDQDPYLAPARNERS
jgi:hypothetical protein